MCREIRERLLFYLMTIKKNKNIQMYARTKKNKSIDFSSGRRYQSLFLIYMDTRGNVNYQINVIFYYYKTDN